MVPTRDDRDGHRIFQLEPLQGFQRSAAGPLPAFVRTRRRAAGIGATAVSVKTVSSRAGVVGSHPSD